MSTIDKSEIKERRKEIAEIRHADGVFRDIQARIKERENYEQRWFWELLQNAKDSVNSDEKVQAKIELTDTTLSFSHTGNPFELDDILSLIIQGSSKVDQEGKDGRFGTGFMTTYLLSKRVNITGKLTGYKGCFSFELNREGSSNEDFFSNQLISNNAFDDSVRNEPYLINTPYQTRFIYQLDKEGKKTAEIGLASMDELIPFTQLFNSKIAAIEFVHNGKLTTYNKTFIEDIIIGESIINCYCLETILDGLPERQLKAYLLKNNVYDVCFLTVTKDGTERIIPLDEKDPRLYFTFPLIGTEDFGIPLVINSSKFDPKIERDGIYLLSQQNNDDGKQESVFITNNKKILCDALSLAIPLFTQLVVKRGVVGIFELFKFTRAKSYTWLNETWLNEEKAKLFLEMANLPCIQGTHTEPLSLNELYVPYDDELIYAETLWHLYNDVKGYNLPHLNNLPEWIAICKEQSVISKLDDERFDFIYEINDLVDEVEALEDLDSLTNFLSISAYDWLNKFYDFVDDRSDIFPLESKILLNQNNKLRTAEGALWDGCKDEELKEISDLIGLRFKNTLISGFVKSFDITGVSEFNLSRAVSQLLNTFNNLQDTDYTKLEIQDATARSLKWLIENNNIDTIKELKILSGDRKKEDDPFIIQVFPKGKHLQLSPKEYFSINYPLYANVIRDRDCMHSVYNRFLNESDYDFLELNGFIYKEPLVIRTEKIDSKIAELLLVEKEQLSSIQDNEGKLNEVIELTYSDFAYLTTSEGHIYDRNNSTTSSLERFKFLLLEASEKDPLFDVNNQIITLSNGHKLHFNQCLWVYRAGGIQWINLKKEETEESKKTKEEPNSKNLSALIKQEADLIKAIKGERQQLFLNRIDVGVSDLIRNTLINDELRLSWDKAITSMIISDANPELVQAIFNDPGIQAEYQRRLLEKGLITRNQKIGGFVEKLFKQAIEKLQQNGVSVHIKREPFGSDYLLTEDSSDLVKDKKLEVFKINDWLVELKATGRQYAAMTQLQAQTAKEKKDNYALVVVPLDGTDPDLKYVEDNARVITNIGYNLEPIVDDFNEAENQKSELVMGKNGVSVSIEDRQVRFRINASHWVQSNSATIENFITEQFTK